MPNSKQRCRYRTLLHATYAPLMMLLAVWAASVFWTVRYGSGGRLQWVLFSGRVSLFYYSGARTDAEEMFRQLDLAGLRLEPAPGPSGDRSVRWSVWRSRLLGAWGGLPKVVEPRTAYRTTAAARLSAELGAGIVTRRGVVVPLWLPTLLLMVLAWWLRAASRPYPRHCCPECGYDLTGAASDRCPECGANRAAMA